VRLSVALHRQGLNTAAADTTVEAHADSLDAAMTAAAASLLQAELARGSALPPGSRNIADYLAADDAFRRGRYDLARTLYDGVISRVPDFAPAYVRRLVVEAQAEPTEQRLASAVVAAMARRGGLLASDSLLLEGYVVLLARGDGRRALQLFRRARDEAPGEPHVRFALGAFHAYVRPLFGTHLDSARAEFRAVLDLEPGFAPAIGALTAIAQQEGDVQEARRLIRLYRTIDATPAAMEAAGLVNVALFGPRGLGLELVNRTLWRRTFAVLRTLAFQSAQPPPGADSALAALAARRALRAMERRAADDDERALAVRWGVAADLATGRPDSARVRLRRAALGGASAAREADRWTVLARAAGLDSLGDWRAARRRNRGRLARGARRTRARAGAVTRPGRRPRQRATTGLPGS
jgi:tetratricopeptide (TPR) repeat protein